MNTMEATVVHVTIDRPWQSVYAFAADPGAMPRWASGLAEGLTRDGETWVAHGPLGDITIRFAPDNAFGVIDHTVTMPSGETVNNALRVVPNGDGAEVMFTLLRQPGMDDAQFAADAEWIRKDLRALKALLEQ
jgi:hypothetical protein